MENHRVASWNIEKGGYEKYSKNLSFDEALFSRLDKINQKIKKVEADTVVISDAQGWGDENIRSRAFSGFSYSNFAPLEDNWLAENCGSNYVNLGVAMATNSQVDNFEIVECEGRNSGILTLNEGDFGLRIAGVYLNHEREDIRKRQVNKLISYLSKNKIPTIIAGDFNAQIPLSEVNNIEKIRSKIVKMGAFALRASGANIISGRIFDLEKRQALADVGDYKNSASGSKNEHKSTAVSPVWAFRVDHIFHSKDLASGNYQVYSPDGLSDHRIISADISRQK